MKLKTNRIWNLLLIVSLIGLYYLSENLSVELRHKTDTWNSSEIQTNHAIDFHCVDYSKVATLPQTVSCASPLLLKVSFSGNAPFITSVFSKILYKTFCGYLKIVPRFPMPLSDFFIDFHNFRS